MGASVRRRKPGKAQIVWCRVPKLAMRLIRDSCKSESEGEYEGEPRRAHPRLTPREQCERSIVKAAQLGTV
jgi:hypothetical protein